ncbi:hypothetical protein [Caballeronia sp. GaOx3]|uniref:hypothetical protein n=1 Tax=Caballeronia sp. GaOx3 TaxID=2921740 RepID=UPI00202830E4|nr:hypothetical protein [Caballeronia sp. GaOx3]
MSFTAGNRVTLTRPLRMSAGIEVNQGTHGTVTGSQLQTTVLFDGFDHSLVIPDGDLTKEAILSPDANQRVRLLQTLPFGPQTVLAGTLGTVTQEGIKMDASWVIFDGMTDDKLVPNSLLQNV